MPLIQLIVVLVVVGLILWLVETQIPMDPTIKMIIRVVIVIAVILWLLTLVGLLPGGTLRVGHAAAARIYVARGLSLSLPT
jgi:hypothetical protein